MDLDRPISFRDFMKEIDDARDYYGDGIPPIRNEEPPASFWAILALVGALVLLLVFGGRI